MVLHPERTNVLLGGMLPVWILMKGLVSLDMGPANSWFNTLFFTIYLGSWCFTSGTLCLCTGLSKEKGKWEEGTPVSSVSSVVVVIYSQCQTGPLLPLNPLSVISLYFNFPVVYLDCVLGTYLWFKSSVIDIYNIRLWRKYFNQNTVPSAPSEFTR